MYIIIRIIKILGTIKMYSWLGYKKNLNALKRQKYKII